MQLPWQDEWNLFVLYWNPSTTFCLTNDLDEVFHKSKEIIILEMKEGVRLFYPSSMICLAIDWAVDGIGFSWCRSTVSVRVKPYLMNWWLEIFLVGSRCTFLAESRYAPISGEAFAVAFALHQTRNNVMGCKDRLVATDHKPLLKTWMIDHSQISTTNDSSISKRKL